MTDSPSARLRALADDIRTRLSITGMTPRWAVETDAIATQVEALEAERDQAAQEVTRWMNAAIHPLADREREAGWLWSDEAADLRAERDAALAKLAAVRERCEQQRGRYNYWNLAAAILGIIEQ